MTYKRVYSYDDLDLFSREHVKTIANAYEELNKDKNITHPTEQEYKKIFESTINKMSGMERCLGTYVSGKHKGERCQATPHPGSKYCLKHKNKDPKNKEVYEKTTELHNLRETNPDKYEEIIKILGKSNLND